MHVRCIKERGFIDSPGCSENLAMLDGIMKLSKKQRKPLNVVFIDFVKAFDTVLYLICTFGMCLKGVKWMSTYGGSSVTDRGCYTTIQTETGTADKI